MLLVLPQKRAIHFLWGFIHGPIYDDWIAVDRGIFLVRLSHLIVGLGLLAFSLVRLRYVTILSLTVLFLGAFTLNQMSLRYPSVQNGHAPLRKILPGQLRGDDFILHFDPASMGTAEDPDSSANKLFAEASFHIHELKEVFKTKPRLIRIYAYPNQEMKKLWFGAASTDVTDVWSPSVHITVHRLPHSTLRHELVHAIASDFGYHGLGFHPNMALTEGLAVALAPEDGALSLDEGASNLLRTNKITDVTGLFSPMFWKESGARAYTVAGSLIQFIIGTYGIDAIKQIYSGAALDKTLPVSSSELLEKWQTKLQFEIDPAKLDLYAESLYRHPGVLYDVCPHSKIDLKRSRDDGYFVRLRQPLGWEPDKNYFDWRKQLEPESRSLWYEEARNLAHKIISDKYDQKNRLQQWITTYAAQKPQEVKTIEDVEFMILLSDVYAFNNDTIASSDIMKNLMPLALSHRLGEALSRQIYTRHYVDQSQDKTVAPRRMLWRRYLSGFRADLPLPATTYKEEPWMLTYLRLRRPNKTFFKHYKLRELATLNPPMDLPDTFKVEWFKLVAEQYVDKSNFKEAAVFYEKAANNAALGRKALLQEHARRMNFNEKLNPSKS
jgi:hypothetical protein